MGENQTSEISHAGLVYSIDKKGKTAKLICCQAYKNNLIIPQTIKHKSNKYAVINIRECAFKREHIVKSIQFPLDSKLQTIEQNAFSYSLIESISIPASLVELNEGWCYGADNLKTIKVDPRNPRYSYYDEKFIIGKLNETSEEFDVLVFARRDITEAKIPLFIKYIGSNAFLNCKQLLRVEISGDSKLQQIDKKAFCCSSIKSIKIPSNVTQICESAFENCYQLRRVDISPNSKLQTIGKNAFACTSIKKISIPSSVTKICESAFAFCINLRHVEIFQDSKLQLIDEFAFMNSSIESFLIPAHVNQINNYAFSQCKKFFIIEIEDKSSIQPLITNFLNIFSYFSVIMIPV